MCRGGLIETVRLRFWRFCFFARESAAMPDEPKQAEEEETKADPPPSTEVHAPEDLGEYYIVSDEYYDDYLFNFYPYGYLY
jgi:hypothetical protein